MKQKELSEMTDEELIAEAKALKSFDIQTALLIGFFFGIIIFSLLNNRLGFLMLIPLYFIHKLANDPRARRSKAAEALLKERGLK